MKLFVMLGLAAGLGLVPAAADVRLSDQTRQAFDAYVRQVEAGMDSAASGSIPGIQERARRGEIVAMPFSYRSANKGASVPIEDGLINHWLGVMFVPGATVDQVRAVLQDYPNYSKIYGPEVAESKIIKANGNDFDIFLRLHRHVRIKALLGYAFDVEFNSNYHVRYAKVGETLTVRSLSTRIAEVKDVKKSHTEEKEPGYDNGYLWSLRSYWRVIPAQGGVFVECEAVSLSRSVPGFVEKMVTYFTTNFPEESMRATLKATRESVKTR